MTRRHPFLHTLSAVAFQPMVAALACLSVHGACTDVEGGAVEVSWDLRRVDGTDTDCESARVGQVALRWDVEGVRGRSPKFPCEDARGVTVFNVDPGRVSLSLQLFCDDGPMADAGSYQAPAPIVRTITEGEVITLVTQILEVNFSDDDAACGAEAPCICR